MELARRILTNCTFCARRCGVDRLNGPPGICRLGQGAVVVEHFLHIGEEAMINPSLVISLAGCGLRCRFCQQWMLLDPASIIGDALGADLWPKLELSGARSMSFIGGNPDESTYAILQFLKAVRPDWKLPIVWNCHGYSTPETIRILNGIVDAYVPDFKYGLEACGLHLSGIAGYPPAAESSVKAMLAQAVPVIIRILVLPGHVECCHIPTLDVLSRLHSETLFVSVRGQYAPDWDISMQDGDLARRSSQDEITCVLKYATENGLQIVD